jgi:hypothetical protein
MRPSTSVTARVSGKGDDEVDQRDDGQHFDGRAVLLDMFWPTNIRSAMPTAETSALSLNRLTQFDRSVGIARSTA